MTQYTEAGTESFDVEAINPDNNSSVHELDSAPTQPAQATEAATPNTQTGFFPFLKLPRELRDQIYHHAVVRHGTICIERDPQNNFKYQPYPHKASEPIPTPLTRVCKQLHTEVIPLIYSRNTFSFYSDSHMHDFITHFAPHTNLTRRLIVDGVNFWSTDMRSNVRLDELIANLSCLLPLENLESLQLLTLFETTREDALSTFVKGIRGWTEAVGARTGDKYKVLDVMKGSTVFATLLVEDEYGNLRQTDEVLEDEVLEEELRRLL